MYAPPSYIPVIVAGGNGSGNALNQLHLPESICVDNDGNMYIGNGGNNRILKWPVGAAAGTLLITGLPTNWNLNPFFPANSIFSMQDLYLDKQGKLYLLDMYAMRVQMWDANSSNWINMFTDMFTSTGMYGYQNTMQGMAFNKDMNLYVPSSSSLKSTMHSISCTRRSSL